MPSSAGQVLARLPLFSQVSEDLREVLARACVPVGLDRGDVLFHAGQDCTGFFVVLRGQVKLTVTSAEGNEKVLEIIGPRETFAEGVMFADRPFPVTATALVACDLLAVPRQTVLDLIDLDPTFARRMLAGMSIRLHQMVADVSAMALHSGTQRVVAFLLDQAAPDDAALRSGGSAVVRLPAGKAVLASRLSLTAETFSRVLRSLTEQGLVEVSGRDVVLPDLRALAGWSDG